MADIEAMHHDAFGRSNSVVSRHQTLLWGQDPVGRARSMSFQPLAGLDAAADGLDDGSPRFPADAEDASGRGVEKLGTIKGVFLPCVQNILGVILFLRLPWITAQAGVWQATGVVGLCVLSTVITSLSLSAIATNGQVQAGGPYYIVSRNLGHEVGGAIGVIFYLGTTFASSMYVLGAVEAFQDGFNIPDASFQTQWIALLLSAALALIVAVGVKYVNMSAMFFLGVVMLSIFSLLLGALLVAAGVYNGSLDELNLGNATAVVTGDNMHAAWEADKSTGDTPSFLWCIGLFYPSVTGIMAGSNRSGVLKDAKKSIPVGTMCAIALTSAIYITVIWLYGMTLSNRVLKEQYLIVTLVAWPHKIIVNFGIIMSCVGAALQCLTGAPRLLSAIAGDGTMPILRPFACQGHQEPVKAVLLTWVVASLPCLAGNLNMITPIITMFFLLMYATVNFSCFILTILKAPGWRPSFRVFSWHTALFGFLMCITLMVLISIVWSLCAFFLCFLVLFYIRKQQVEKDWGDSIAGIRFDIAREQLMELTEKSTRIYHPKNWRPQLLVLLKLDEHGNPARSELLTFAAMLKKGRGLLMTLGLIKGNLCHDAKKVERFTECVRLHMREHTLEGFPHVLVYEDGVMEAMATALQATGCGALRPNTIVMGWPSWGDEPKADPKRCSELIEFVRKVNGSQKAVIMLKNGATLMEYMSKRADPSSTIDVWWIVHDGGLLLLLPHLLHRHRAWKGCSLRIFAVINEYTDGEEEIQAFKVRIELFLENIRIKAEVIPVNLTTSAINLGYSDTANSGASTPKGMVQLSTIYAGILKNRKGEDLLSQMQAVKNKDDLPSTPVMGAQRSCRGGGDQVCCSAQPLCLLYVFEGGSHVCCHTGTADDWDGHVVGGREHAR